MTFFNNPYISDNDFCKEEFSEYLSFFKIKADEFLIVDINSSTLLSKISVKLLLLSVIFFNRLNKTNKKRENKTFWIISIDSIYSS